MKKQKPYRTKRRNALYLLVAEFKRNNPSATATAAWLNFAAVASLECHTVIRRYDAVADALEYVPDVERIATKRVARRAFFNQWYSVTPNPKSDV